MYTYLFTYRVHVRVVTAVQRNQQHDNGENKNDRNSTLTLSIGTTEGTIESRWSAASDTSKNGGKRLSGCEVTALSNPRRPWGAVFFFVKEAATRQNFVYIRIRYLINIFHLGASAKCVKLCGMRYVPVLFKYHSYV